jgi:hypothetical protein
LIKKLGAVALAATFVLTACSEPSAIAGYTGKATIQKAERHSRKGGCILTVKTPAGHVGDVRVGRRTSCDGWNQGRVVNLNDGYLQK